MLMSLNPQASVVAKITDFGTAELMTEMIKVRKVSNPVWLAPEILLGNPYNEKVDTYAYGIMLYEILTRSDFFGGENFMSDFSDHVISGDRPVIPPYCPQTFAMLIQKCWDELLEEKRKTQIIWRKLHIFNAY